MLKKIWIYYACLMVVNYHEKRFVKSPSIPDSVNDHLGKLKLQTSSFSFAFSLLRERSVTMIWLLESKSRLEPALAVKHTGKEQTIHAFVSSKGFLNESCTLNVVWTM